MKMMHHICIETIARADKRARQAKATGQNTAVQHGNIDRIKMPAAHKAVVVVSILSRICHRCKVTGTGN